MTQQKLVINITTGQSELVDLAHEEIEQGQKHQVERAEIEALEAADLVQFQTDWDALQKDDVSQEVIVRLLRRLLPHKPE